MDANSERRASQTTHDELLKHFSNTEKPSVNVKPETQKQNF